ncbi:unnamed protein product [Adineta ricciae]|uniref:Protein kinase domain-containing protein n=1 Tax=Adineta ricciae TaxID=249248 RepID=A0A813SAK6_ADIRI|nr:unnamed protein product [Adineta ricciae]
MIVSSMYIQPYVTPYSFYYVPQNPNDQRPYAYRSVPMEHHVVSIHKQTYIFDRKLATRRFSSVYTARRRVDNKPVAIKVFSFVGHNNREVSMIAQSFMNEIRMTRHLVGQSNHIIYSHDFDFHNTGLSFIVMELGQQDLEKYLSQRSTISSTERKVIWRQLVAIATVLHNSQIIHLNISPDNLIVFYGNLIKLTDFGMAQKVNEPGTITHGTPPYSAPELTIVSRHNVPNITSKADIWSLGAILYRMTYMTPPDYIEPCHRPLPHQNPVQDSHLLSVLRHTLLIDARDRADASWLTKHPYTTTT